MSTTGINGPIVSIFQDNINIIRAKNLEVIGCFKAELIVAFEIIDMGLISFYLGLKIN